LTRLANAAATDEFGRGLAKLLQIGDVIALSGPLGAGKTSLARGILSGLGFVEEAPSPSFAIVIPYDPPDVRISVQHIDLYRIDDEADVLELGLDEARADAALLIEWPERMGAMLWADALKLTLMTMADGARSLTAQVPPSWEGRWSPQ
jgi:tRNA threonylcarbamoyladenosine biosynthesis protein TsaE